MHKKYHEIFYFGAENVMEFISRNTGLQKGLKFRANTFEFFNYFCLYYIPQIIPPFNSFLGQH